MPRFDFKLTGLKFIDGFLGSEFPGHIFIFPAQVLGRSFEPLDSSNITRYGSASPQPCPVYLRALFHLLHPSVHSYQQAGELTKAGL